MSQIAPGEAFGAPWLARKGLKVLLRMACSLSTELKTHQKTALSCLEAWTNKPRMRERWNTLAWPPVVCFYHSKSRKRRKPLEIAASCALWPSVATCQTSSRCALVTYTVYMV